MLGCPYTFTTYNVTLMKRQISVEVNEKHSFWLRWDICLTLPRANHVTGVIGFQKLIYTCQKKRFSDFKQKSSVLRVSVLFVKLFYLYCLFELKYCNYGLGRHNFNTEINFAWVSINYTHVYTVSIQNKMAPRIDCLPTHRLLSVSQAWGRKISKLYYQTFPQKNRCSEFWHGKQSELPPNLFKKQAIWMWVPPRKRFFYQFDSTGVPGVWTKDLTSILSDIPF